VKSRQVQFWCVMGAAVVLASCGGGSGAPADGGRHDASGSFQCGSDAGGEATLSQVAVDHGVGIEQYARAMSIARCNYWSRCFGLAPYVANECVDALVALGTWNYLTCTGNATESTCRGLNVFYSSTALLQAVSAGTVRYDSQRSGQCVAALLAEGCGDYQLIEDIPACTGVFTCATDAGSGGAADGGADAGATCAGLLLNVTPLRTCSTAADCVGAASPQGPYCVAGFCAASQCELSSRYCTAYAQVGQPCLNNASNVVDYDVETPTETCAPGLACSGAVDGGVGTCVTPQDVGGSCTRTSDCDPGLACACGICQIPPTAGPCADGLCKIGVAYCDFASNVCKPVHPLGDSCPGVFNSCGPGLMCDVSTCQPPS
jgi:hypothetical protein